jgi:hypothetical protein
MWSQRCASTAERVAVPTHFSFWPARATILVLGVLILVVLVAEGHDVGHVGDLGVTAGVARLACRRWRDGLLAPARRLLRLLKGKSVS